MNRDASTPPMDSHPIDELAALAVDAVDDVERRRIERHIANCAPCRDELDTLRQTAALLATDEESVSDDLRGRVLAAVDVEPRRSARLRAALAGAAAVVLIAVGAGIGGAVWSAQRDDPPAGGTGDQMSQVLAAPDMRKATATVGADGSVAAMYSPSHRATVVSVDGLPDVDPAMGYQVWITVGGTPKSAGVVGAGGPSSVMMTDMDRPADIGLSVEPMSGSPEPTSPMVVSVPIQ